MQFSLTLAVDDLERSEAFYTDVLLFATERLRPAPGHPPLLLLRAAPVPVMLRENGSLEALHPALFQNLDRHPHGVGVILEFTLADLAPVQRNIDRRQLHTLYELEDEEFHRRELWLHDPDGYLVVLNEERGS